MKKEARDIQTNGRTRKRTIERADMCACSFYRVDDARDLYIRDWGTTFADNPRAPISLSNRANSAFGVCRFGTIAPTDGPPARLIY